MPKVIPINSDDSESVNNKDDVESQDKKSLNNDRSIIEIAKDNKYKVIVGVLAVIGIVVGVSLGLLMIIGKGKEAEAVRKIIDPLKQKSASKATKVQTVSVLPSKSSDSKRRLNDNRFDLAIEGLDHLRKLAKSPSSFSSNSDYNLFPDPEFVVGEKAAEAVTFINYLGCLTNQFRTKDVGMNTTYNPNLLPYVALVDHSKCDKDEKIITAWYVSVKGPDGLGDGDYVTNFMTRLGEGLEIRGTINSNVKNNELIYTKFDFADVDLNYQGALIIDFNTPDVTDITFLEVVEGQEANPGYIHARFNTRTFAGTAVTAVFNDESEEYTKYELDFDDIAINRKSMYSDSTINEVCIDFDAENAMRINDRYTLFSAETGEIRLLETGFPITAEVTIEDKQYVVDLYASYYGLWSSPYYDEDNFIDSETILSEIQDEHPVSKIDYTTNTEKTYTLKKTNARLNKVTRKTISLKDLKMVPLKINMYGNRYDGTSIMWTGSKLVIAGESKKKCVKISKDTPWDYSNLVATSFTVTDDWQCGCLDTTGPKAILKTSGDYNGLSYENYDEDTGEFISDWFQSIDVESVQYNVTKFKELKPTSDMFPNGLNFELNGFWAAVQFEHDSVQVVHGLDYDNYKVGQNVTQDLENGKTAKGTINTAGGTYLVGLDCPTIEITGWIESVDGNYILNVISKDPAAAELGSGLTITVSMSSEMSSRRLTGDEGEEGDVADEGEGEDDDDDDGDDFLDDGSGDETDDYYAYDDDEETDAEEETGVDGDINENDDYPFETINDTEPDEEPYTWTQFVGLLGDEIIDVNGDGVKKYKIQLGYVDPSTFGSEDDHVTLSTRSCGSYTYFSQWDIQSCGGTKKFVSHVPKGSILTQGTGINAVKALVMEDYNPMYNTRFAYKMLVGKQFVKDEEEITIGKSPNPESEYKDFTGSLLFPSESVLDTSLPLSYEVKDSDNTSGCSDSDNPYDGIPIDLPKSNAKVQMYYYKYEFGDQVYEYVWFDIKNKGTQCTSIDSEIAYNIKSEVPTCDITVYFKCTVREETGSSSISVQLTDKEKFVAGKPLKVDAKKVSDYVWWVEDSQGDMKPVNGDTKITYQSRTLVMPGDTVPDLLCYESCPSPTQDGKTSPSSSMASHDYVKYLQSAEGDGGKCKVKPTAVDYEITFNGFAVGKEPTIDIQFEEAEEYDPDGDLNTVYNIIKDVTITDPGHGCDNPTATITIKDSAQSTVDCSEIKLSLTCSSYNDYKDGRNAYHYKFDKASGLLIDKKTNNAVQLGPNGDQKSFGPFFEGSSNNLQSLKCDWDDKQLCTWNVYFEIDTYYMYDTGGPYSEQVSLVDGSGGVVKFEQPITVTGRYNGNGASGKVYDDSMLILTYYGQGELSGFPKVCLNKNSMAPGACSKDTEEYDDISLPPDFILTDLDGKEYYAKPEIIHEFYKKSKSQSITQHCTDNLQFTGLPSIPTNAVLTNPANIDDKFPGDDDKLLAGYFLGGNPAAVAGITIYELIE